MTQTRVLPRAVLTAILVGWVTAATAAAAAAPAPPAVSSAPEAVSPGEPALVALVEARCPGFSWGLVPGATSYELVVWEVGAGGEVAGEGARPALAVRLPGSVTSWTPSLDRCLVPGGRYAWVVRAVGAEKSSPWSEARLFSVASGPTRGELEEALAVVRAYLAAGGDEANLAGASEVESGAQTAGGAVTSSEPAVTAPAGAAVNIGSANPVIWAAPATDAAGTVGVAGVSASVDGAGAVFGNKAGGPDLVLDGSMHGAEDTVLTESGIEVGFKTFEIGNASDDLALTLDGISVVTTATFPQLLDSANTFTEQNVFTSTPTGSGVGQGPVYINPASASEGQTLLGVGVGGVEKLRVDSDGILNAAGAVFQKEKPTGHLVYLENSAGGGGIYSYTPNGPALTAEGNPAIQAYGNVDVSFGTFLIKGDSGDLFRGESTSGVEKFSIDSAGELSGAGAVFIRNSPTLDVVYLENESGGGGLNSYTPNGPAVRAEGFPAIQAYGNVDINGPLRLNPDGPDGDSSLFFYEGEVPTGRSLTWDDSADEFVLNDALEIQGALTTAGSFGVVAGGTVNAGGSLTSGDGSLYLNSDGPNGDSQIYFYDDGSPIGEYLRWDQSEGKFVLTAPLGVGPVADTGPSNQMSALYFYSHATSTYSEQLHFDYGGFHLSDDLSVSGNLSKMSGSFKIDHPLEPADKYLYHSFVESPDMKNVYDGVVVLDDSGEAVVELPEWFEALNSDFRYQLTTVGGFAAVYVADEIAGNRFRVAGGTAGLKVSWQVTGIRQDPWARDHRIRVEEEKPEAERGTYLYPEGFGQPAGE